MYAVTITAGDSEQCTTQGYRVPKRDLVMGVQLLLEAGSLAISRGLEAGEELLQELRAMQVSMTARGHERFEGLEEHDDLVLATALAF